MIAGAALPRTSICCDVRGADRDSRGRPGRPPRLGATAGAGIVVVPGRIEADLIETTNLELPTQDRSAVAQVQARVGRKWRWPRGALADLPDRYHLGPMLII